MSVQLTSGLWAGHYEQSGRRHAQHMTIEFSDGIVRGDGRDGIGRFTLEGEYRIEDGEVRLGWIKTYEGAHSVLYLGAIARDRIKGRWHIGSYGGAFALRPEDSQEIA